MGKFYESFGLSRIAGQIIGLLILSEKPLSHEDIQSVLKISRGSISTNIKMIMLTSGLEEMKIEGDRKLTIDFQIIQVKNLYS
jgi:DNA-binding transcriptional regulator GbsR (MarR family)